MITIGTTKLETTRPADLDAVLIAATGCSAADHVAMIGNRPTPVGVATALRPFLPDSAPSAAEIAGMINDDDLVRVRGDVVALLKAPAPAEPAPAPAPLPAPVPEPAPAPAAVPQPASVESVG